MGRGEQGQQLETGREEKGRDTKAKTKIMQRVRGEAKEKWRRGKPFNRRGQKVSDRQTEEIKGRDPEGADQNRVTEIQGEMKHKYKREKKEPGG